MATKIAHANAGGQYFQDATFRRQHPSLFSSKKAATNASVCNFCCYVLICLKFTPIEKLFNIERNAACALTLNILYVHIEQISCF